MPTPTPRIGYQKPSGSESFTRTSLTDFMDRADEYADWLADNYDHDVVLTRVGGVLTKIEEKLPSDTGTLRVETTLTKVGGVLSSTRERVFQGDGVTLVKDVVTTLIRSDGILAEVQVRKQ